MKRKKNTVYGIFLILIMMSYLTGCLSDTVGKTDKPKKDYSNIEMNPNISIPGYESLDFKAGKKKQSVNFYNPEENTCYFRISLVLKENGGSETGSEGDADEDILWTSDLVKPGEEVKSIKLDKELDSGDYPAILKYECFSLKDETPLNGSNVELILEVR